MSSGFYRAFEDRYRGTRSLILDRLAVYLPFVKPLCEAGMSSALDLGCGRGEWLEILGQAGFSAEGVDLDDGMLAACRERGLKVSRDDAFDVLRARGDGSVSVISAFHLVEHIAFDQVQTLIQEALRVLQPGGLLIMETPNPENLVVGTSSFYDDPSHMRPLPAKLLAFTVEYGGFARCSVLRLQESRHLHGTGPVTLFDVLGGVSPDYSVVAQKADAPAALAVLDPLFEASYGMDLHTLAQRHQQGLDQAGVKLEQLRSQQESTALAVEQQLAEVDRRVTHIHSAASTLQANVDERLDQIEAALRRLQVDGARERTQTTTQLHSRIGELEEQHRAAVNENGRLAQHVAWIESRLTHAEAEAAGLRHQQAELLRRRAGLAGLGPRALGAVRRRVVGTARSPRLRQYAYTLLRPAIQQVLRRPALKRLARRIIDRFPQLHTRLLRVMYAPTPINAGSPVDMDPLTSEMSPRSLKMYRAMLAASKQRID